MRRALYAAALLVCASPVCASVRDVRREGAARNFGFFLGDVFTVTAQITTDGATVLDRASLPQPGPVSRTADITHVAMSEQRAGDTRIVRVEISYQNFFGPDTATETEIPGYTLDFSDTGKHVTVFVPPWRYSVAALRHDVVAVTDPRRLRPDHPPQYPGAAAARLRLLIASACALVSGAAFLLMSGYGPRLRTSSRPFAGAAPHLRRRLRRGDGREALVELHRAFDATAGRTLLSSDIESFLAQHAQFATLRHDIIVFFAASQSSFFGGSPPHSISVPWLRDFLRRLVSAERR